jgi:hypothetical protein
MKEKLKHLSKIQSDIDASQRQLDKLPTSEKKARAVLLARIRMLRGRLRGDND